MFCTWNIHMNVSLLFDIDNNQTSPGRGLQKFYSTQYKLMFSIHLAEPPPLPTHVHRLDINWWYMWAPGTGHPDTHFDQGISLSTFQAKQMFSKSSFWLEPLSSNVSLVWSDMYHVMFHALHLIIWENYFILFYIKRQAFLIWH